MLLVAGTEIDLMIISDDVYEIPKTLLAITSRINLIISGDART